VRRSVTLAAAALAAAALVAAPAAASTTQESIVEDEHLLLQRDAETRDRALDDFVRLGADTVRSLVYWHQVAPDPGNKRKPKGFDAANPAAYPHYVWDRYDDLVRGAQARGLDLLLSPSSPLPAWASGCKGTPDQRRACKPKVAEFARFVQALGTRYSGTYSDENQGGGVLPRVSRWSVWNEPNQAGWLAPQHVRRKGRTVPEAAHRYRALVQAAIKGLRASGHGSDQILLGETSPLGRTSGPLAKRPITPVRFISELLCLDERGRPQRGARARANGCRKPGKLAVTGFAHHPYTANAAQPPRTRALPGWITISTAGRLKTLLDRGARARRIPRGLPILYTEFGFQTNPPDRFGVSPAAQASHLNESDWIAYRDPRVRAVAQYKLNDDQAFELFQTGLRFYNDTPKPAYAAYQLPIWVSRHGSGRVRVYGQVRPLPAVQHGRDGCRHLAARSLRRDVPGARQALAPALGGDHLARGHGRSSVGRSSG
jgi:hypothetical protein